MHFRIIATREFSQHGLSHSRSAEEQYVYVSVSVRITAMSPLYANLVRIHARVCVIYTIYMYTYVRIYKRRCIYIRTYSRGAFSRRKSRREIIMQKMHRADYDLICRARKQFVSLKEGFPVNLRNYRLRLCSVLCRLR